MTALERAARAVWDSVCLTNDDKSGGYVGTMRDKPFYVDGFVDPADIARAVLMAVRDAGMSDAMNEARDDEIERLYPHASPEAYGVSDGEWRSMIDAILNEKDTTDD